MRLEGDLVERPRAASLRLLADALGLDPREQDVLTAVARSQAVPAAEPDERDGDEPPEVVVPTPPRPRQLPVGVAGFAGRTGALEELDRHLDAGAGGTRICVVTGTVEASARRPWRCTGRTGRAAGSRTASST